MKDWHKFKPDLFKKQPYYLPGCDIYKLLAVFTGFGANSGNSSPDTIRGIGFVLAAVFGGPFIVWRSIVAQQQVKISEQGQITDRISKAVEGLGAEKTVKRQRKNSKGTLLYKNKEGTTDPDFKQPIMEEVTEPNLEVRVGSIYALERIAQDSERDHIQIMEILCTYVRQNAPAYDTMPTSKLFTRPRPRIDIQTSIRVIGRRSSARISLEAAQKYRLDLRNCDLSGVDFNTRDYSAAMFHDCRMEAALFRETKLHGTEFFAALLNHSDFWHADMRGARLDHAIINLPIPKLGGMNMSINQASTIYGVTLRAAEITAVDYLGEAKEMNATFGSKDTQLSDLIEETRKEINISILRTKIRVGRRKGNTSEADALQAKLDESGFASWSPYTADDLGTRMEMHEFWTKLGLTEFPFHGKK
ncbi:MAG: hypothetical protein COB16_16735 [Rhodobacteraceae bacterium]|nr:MAG: hypothetical protein COB16_16735 [Paracoccaceae bacterium]